MTNERFQEYVEEFRAFSRFHKVGCGHPHDLLVLMITVRSSERFRVELSSMVRSVLYREREGVRPPELEGLIAVAWGGGEEMAPAAEMAEIRGFLRDVMSRPAGEPLEILAEKEDGEVKVRSEVTPARATMADAMAMKVKEDSGEKLRAKRNPWMDGSALHEELMRFAEWRRKSASKAGA